jgi:hypothetical protein
VERAQAANYSGVIIYNNKDDELIPMGESDVICIILRLLVVVGGLHVNNFI